MNDTISPSSSVHKDAVRRARRIREIGEELAALHAACKALADERTALYAEAEASRSK